MWVEIISFSIHWLMALAFFMLIPFPFFVKGMQGENLLFIKKVYRPITLFAHAAVIGTVVTGIFLIDEWLSWWTAAVFILWLVISAFLGMTAKSLRETLTTEEKSPLLKHSTLLTIAVTVMFIFKFSKGLY
ncbi:hypothetical protein [Bacillus piscicola]|uniref:hypothetical protein n=1 Tax=Bacillus piscicola TaxID=1632684 RepID=UPI001F08E779|nr:hypothetical protein [Bacillus piscicola]